ncbi:MAG: 2TM domain-containing protein [Chitinophagaceae bacterium]
MPYQTKWEASAPISPQKGFRIHLLVFILVTPAIWLLWYLTGSTYPWPLWSTPAWAIGLLFHYLGVFVFKSSKKN